MITFKQINIENRPYYFFNKMININNSDSNLLNIDKMSFKSNDAVTYHVKYITMKSLDHVNIDSASSLYLVFKNVDGYIQKENADKHLIFASIDKNKAVLKKNKKLWDKIENQTETVNGGEPIKYRKNFMKVRIESDDELTLGKILSIPSIIIVTRSVFQEDGKRHPQVYLHDCVCVCVYVCVYVCVCKSVREF